MAEQKPVVITVGRYPQRGPRISGSPRAGGAPNPSDRVLVVLSERPQPAEARTRHCTRTARATARQLHPAPPLSPRGVREMVDADTGARTAAPPAADLHALTGGSPLLVRGAVPGPARVRRQVPAADVPPGRPAFGHALLGCLHSAGPTTLAVARGIALLGRGGHPSALLARRLLDLRRAVARAEPYRRRRPGERLPTATPRRSA